MGRDSPRCVIRRPCVTFAIIVFLLVFWTYPFLGSLVGFSSLVAYYITLSDGNFFLHVFEKDGPSSRMRFVDNRRKQRTRRYPTE
jgi:hypothetical protein